MTARDAESDILKCYSPDSRLRDYLEKRLQLSTEMEGLDAAGLEFTPEINARDKSLRTTKVRVLDIVFQAMADLTYFVKTIALHPGLQQILEGDIKDLLGVRHLSTQNYAFMLLDLLRSILVTEGSKTSLKRDDFRLRLNSEIQGLVVDTARPFLPSVFNNVHAEHAVRDDLVKAWAWTRMLAVDKGFGDPHRTFDLSDSRLLKE